MFIPNLKERAYGLDIGLRIGLELNMRLNIRPDMELLMGLSMGWAGTVRGAGTGNRHGAGDGEEDVPGCGTGDWHQMFLFFSPTYSAPCLAPFPAPFSVACPNLSRIQ